MDEDYWSEAKTIDPAIPSANPTSTPAPVPTATVPHVGPGLVSFASDAEYDSQYADPGAKSATPALYPSSNAFFISSTISGRVALIAVSTYRSATSPRYNYPTDFSSLEGVEPGDYWKDPDHGWFAACPVPADDQGFLLYATLCKHTITEHEDGTITVSPSILVGATNGGIASREWVDKHTWHGWLERGEWRTA